MFFTDVEFLSLFLSFAGKSTQKKCVQQKICEIELIGQVFHGSWEFLGERIEESFCGKRIK